MSPDARQAQFRGASQGMGAVEPPVQVTGATWVKAAIGVGIAVLILRWGMQK